MSALSLSGPRDAKGWLVTPALGFILALFVYPFAYGLMLSFEPMNGGGILANYTTFFTDSAMWPTVLVTLKLAVPATIINVGLSVPAAFALRRKSPYQKFVTTLLVIPVTLGTVLIADGMLSYFSPNGWFTQAVQALHLYGDEVRLTHNYWGVLISLVVSGFPFAFLLTLSYVTGIDPTLARAAATLGAGPWQQFRQVYLPLLVPGLTMAACLSFVQAFSVFPSAVLLGAPAGPTRVISIAASEAAFENYDYSLASTIAIVMGFVQLLVVAGMLGARRFFYTGPVTGGKG
ncbi:sugar ABC transporter permease [Trinickia caryophylli]|uniref:Carbohydrate ABC transporter membrane protein 1, CUT1 family n=1 Tax=Trinickia caryophylli TaxID=28094 RepID=A0A1X7H0X4_TRICW|nr:sugar ABC transporter permease [Trinickia caryophylli]PMS09951.1 sugar ABC transporter permease [Trinickia caryophylli]TRX18300.1 sugar ABC transporter permease [Trinickia caryophylli]WQE10917.1 sugar ABC transporter permease [Trinickia caryophylli]SMF77698.1 carbohydrate ABC transporter membrane protein 1, CUT1 family [Trinickia caryophylli]GLU35569.1 ABC transporter permease [Trinickia caryophylli]